MSEDPLTHYMEATERMRQRAELAEAERDHLQDDLASVAMAVAGDRTGVIEQDDIVDLVREVVAERDAHADEIEFYRERMNELIAERDRLRAVVETLTHGYIDHSAECAVYPCDCGLDDVLRQLDGSEDMGDG